MAISDKAIVDAKAKLGENCVVAPFAVVEEAVVGSGTKLWRFCHVRKGARIGSNCIIGNSVYVDAGAVIGNGCKLQNNSNVYHGVTIGNNVFVGPNVSFTNDLRPRAGEWNDERLGYTLVEDGVSIGANSVIVCGNKNNPRVLAKNCMVGAGSVVAGSVPPHALYYGNPATLRGWVCECGEKLADEKATNGAKLSCSCGKNFTVKK